LVHFERHHAIRHIMIANEQLLRSIAMLWKLSNFLELLLFLIQLKYKRGQLLYLRVKWDRRVSFWELLMELPTNLSLCLQAVSLSLAFSMCHKHLEI
jgi:hypothetical protein